MSKIIEDGKDSDIDTSIIYPNEHFTYAGRTYVKKMTHDFEKNEDGSWKFNKKILPSGHLIDGTQVPTKEWAEFYELELVKTDSERVLNQFGKPLTTQIIPHGPVDPRDVFKYEGEQIRYENFDLRNLILTRKGNKIVKVEGEVRKSRYSKELGYSK